MRPIFYEIRRTLTSKFVILMIVAIIGLSSLLAYESAAGFGSASLVTRAPNVIGGYYISNGELNVVTYAYDDHGTPYNALELNMTYQNVEKNGTSSNSGFANFTYTYNRNATVVSYNYTYSLFGLRTHSGSSDIVISPFSNFSGYNLAERLTSSDNSSNLGFLVFYVGDNGSTAPQTNLYIATNSGSSQSMTNNEVYKNHTLSYNVSGFTVKTFFPALTNNQLNETFDLALMSQGALIPSPGGNAIPLGKLSIYTPMTESDLQSLILNGIGSILGLLIPILGVFAGYLTYGKDKTTGVLESVLKRPVTRSGLISSRFTANSVSIVASIITSMVIADLIIDHYFHMFPTLYFTLFYIWTYVVEGLAFLALIYMFSRVVKSQGALLGITIAVFVVMGLFWSIIPVVAMLALGITASSSSYLPLTLLFDFASPSGYSSLVSFFFTNSIGSLTPISANPATYGVTQLTLILAGFLWMAVPFAIAVYLAKRTD